MDQFVGLPWERTNERTALASRIAAQVARAIVERRYEAGALLTEADLALSQGVSRTPAREAMLQLESWSLVRLPPKKGAIVTPVTLENRRDLLAVRALFEIDAIASLRAKPDELAEVGKRLDLELSRQQEALRAGHLLEFASADYAFHACIILGGGNAVVARLLEELGPQLARLTYLAVTENPHRLKVLAAEHTELAVRARAGDEAGFAALVHEHVASGHFQPGGVS